MTLESKMFNFEDIVPTQTLAERYLPTLVGFARKIREYGGKSTPKEFPTAMTVRMPEIPFGVKENHPLLYFFERVKEVADKINVQNGKKLTFLLDEKSYDLITDVPFHGDGTFGGDAMFHVLALRDYSTEWFIAKGYRVTSVGVGSNNTFNLNLKLI